MGLGKAPLTGLKTKNMKSEAYGKSYERGFRLTVRFLMSRGVCGDSAEEAAQVAWTKGWEHLGQLRDDRMVVTWVNSIAWNVIRSLARKLPLQELPEVAVPPTVNLAAIDVDRALRYCKTAESCCCASTIWKVIG